MVKHSHPSDLSEQQLAEADRFVGAVVNTVSNKIIKSKIDKDKVIKDILAQKRVKK